MSTIEWNRLKSGTDVRGVALEGVAGEPVTLTEDIAQRLGEVFALWLERKAGKAATQLMVSIGRDSRLSSTALLRATVKGLAAQGVTVLDCSLSSTPAMFMTTLPEHLDCDGAVMVTASHLPWNRNGLKFFTKNGGLEGADITALLRACADGVAVEAQQPGSVRAVDFMPRYAAALAETLRRETGKAQPLQGLRVVVDAGNGVGGFFVDSVLKPLGADTTGSQFLEPDGHFPNHIPNPEEPEAMEAISHAVRLSHADLGIIFDTDCDRAAVVAPDGSELNRNRLVALMSAIVLENAPGGTIVTDSITSTGLTAFIAAHGGVHRRFKRGYKNVIDEAIRLEGQGVSAPMAIETSGHCALRENHFLDDGAYLVVKVLAKLARLHAEGRKLMDLVASLAEPAEAVELRFKLTVPDFKALCAQVLQRVTAARVEGWQPEAENFEGVRINSAAGDGWLLLRMSLHDPVMPLNIESDRPGGARVIAAELAPLLRGIDGLDITAIESFLSKRI